MRKYINTMQSVVVILCCTLVVGCTNYKKSEEFDEVGVLQGIWYINSVVGHPKNDNKIFILKKIKKEEHAERYIYGTTISIKDKSFDCVYSAPCGNDCFPSSNGLIGQVNKQQIKIFVKEFKQHGMVPDCEKKHLQLNKDLGIYNIEKVSEKEIKLVKEE